MPFSLFEIRRVLGETLRTTVEGPTSNNQSGREPKPLVQFAPTTTLEMLASRNQELLQLRHKPYFLQ